MATRYVQQSSTSTCVSDHELSSSSSGEGLLLACFAPVVVYIIAYGTPIQLAYLFGCIVLARAFLSFRSSISSMKPAQSRSPTAYSGRISISKSSIGRARPISGVRSSPHSSPKPAPFGRSLSPVVPTAIVSADCPITKLRRSILNKISPEKLDELASRLVETFNRFASGEVRMRDAGDFVALVFTAASRQPQYIGVFAELITRVFVQVIPPEVAEQVLTTQSQIHWSTICLAPVEKSTKNWDQLTEDDQIDIRGRHKAKQLAVAEFCGLLASYELIPASFPLNWLETLMRPMSVAARNAGSVPQGSSTEAAIEVVSSAVRGLGPSEAQGLFTDIDQARFAKLCDTLFGLPSGTSRVKCLLRDLKELRDSGWSKLPTWKLALVPTKRASS